ncbi:MAG: amidohydrolase family protein [Phycisphaerales bacterium]
MTVDFCTRIWNGRDPWGEHAGAHGPVGDGATASVHEAAMSCVEVAVVVGYASDRLDVRLDDEAVLAAVEQMPERRVGVLGVDVSRRDALQAVDAAAGAEGIIGVAVSPADQGVRPTDDRFVEVVRAASERGLVVMIQNPGLFHPRSDLSFADPRLIDELLRDHHEDALVQSARLVLGDFGCVPIEHTMAVVAKHERVFVEMSAVAGRPGRLRTAIFGAHEFGIASRVLFASGFPRETPERAIERLYSVNAGSPSGDSACGRVPREVLRQIVEGDALGKLGIRHIWAGSGTRPEAGMRASVRAGLLSSGETDDDTEDAAW